MKFNFVKGYLCISFQLFYSMQSYRDIMERKKKKQNMYFLSAGLSSKGLLAQLNWVISIWKTREFDQICCLDYYAV